ncbi:MAG: flagellar export chaperone FliS [Succinivibrionaceae bacterium]
MAGNSYLNAYKKNGLETDLSVADGHRVIQLLYQGLIDCIYRAKAAIETNNIDMKAKQIDKALGIVAGLDAAIQYDPNNPEQTKIAKTLKNMYAIYTDRLMQASFKLSVEPLDEILKYATEIKAAWDKISDEDKAEGYAMQMERDKS